MNIPFKLLSTVLLGLGTNFLVSPFVAWLLFYSSSERYLWTIQGPFPFNYAGSSAGLLFVLIGILLLGFFLIFLSQLIKK